jgi:hypothetical protein
MMHGFLGVAKAKLLSNLAEICTVRLTLPGRGRRMWPPISSVSKFSNNFPFPLYVFIAA